MTHPSRETGLRVGVVGAGRVGAVLAAALARRRPRVVAAAGESDASRTRIATLLPGVPHAQADRRRPRLRPAAAHRARRHARQRRRRCSPPAARSARASSSCTPPAGTASPCSPPAAAVGARVVAMHPAMTFTGTDARPRPAARLRLRRHRRRRASARSPRTSSPTSAAARCGCPRRSARSTTPVSPTAPTTWSPWSARRWSCSPPPAPRTRPARCARCSTAALDNALDQGDAALTGPIVRGDVKTVRAHLADIAANAPAHAPVVRRDGARHRSTARSPTAGCCRSGPPRSGGSSTRAERAAAPTGPRADRPAR